MSLKERLYEIALEYSKKVSELLGVQEGYWVAKDICINVCDFGDTMFLSLSNMQVIVEHYDKWLEKYGDKEKVTDRVLSWFDYYITYPDPVNLYYWMNNPEVTFDDGTEE